MDLGEAGGRSEAWRAVVATVAACLLVTLVGWASLIGPSQVFTGPGPTPSQTTTTTTEAPVDDDGEKDREDVEEQEYSTGVTVVANLIGGAIQLFAFLGTLFVVYLIARRARQAWRLRRRYDAPDERDFRVLEDGDPERVRRSIDADGDEQLQLLLGGRPRNAIVACWHRFESQAVEAGLPRHPWETSAEFALRMLERADVDSRAVADLMALYGEARFSSHELDESHRERAVAALRAIRTDARAGTRSRTRP